jgi:hypothetical protein
MEDELWSYIQNPFENGTRGNFKKAEILVADHDDKLYEVKDDEVLGPLYARFHPFRVGFGGLFTSLGSAYAAHEGATRATKILLRQLSGLKIRSWDRDIQKAYDIDTAEYKAILPNRRKPFQTGSIEMKIQALETLIANIGDNVTLRSIKTEIITFTEQLKATRTLQQGKERIKPDLSGQLELQRLKTMIEMHRNLGSLIEIFADNPSRIEGFFQLSLLRRRTKSKDKGPANITVIVDPMKTVKVDVVFGDTARFWMLNYSEVPVTVFVSGEDPVAPVNPFILAPGEEAEKNASELGPAGSRFLYFSNNNPDIKGEVEMAKIKD